MPFPNPEFEPSTHQVARSASAKSGVTLPKLCTVGPKTAPKRIQNGQTKENGFHSLQPAWFPRVKELFGDLSLHDMSEKCLTKSSMAQTCAVLDAQPLNQEWAVSMAVWLKIRFPGHLDANPGFLWFPPLQIAQTDP